MKKILTLCFSILLPGSFFSQSYVTFPDSNVTWVNTFSVAAGAPIQVCQLYAVNNFCAPGTDTTINSQVYSHIVVCGTGTYKGALRDNGAGKVYYVPKDSTQEFLLYDFTASAGDTIYNFYSEDFYGTGAALNNAEVLGVDSVLINGLYRKVLQLPGAQWIEGVGNTYGFLMDPFLIPNSWCFELYCMSAKDTTLYPTNAPGACDLTLKNNVAPPAVEAVVYPNPSPGSFVVETNGNAPGNIELFNMQGQRVPVETKLSGTKAEMATAVPPGIYTLRLRTAAGMLFKKIVIE